MKKLFGLLFILSFGSASQASDASTVMRGFNLRNCSKTKCVKVEAVKAESGAFSPMLSLRQVEITIKHGKSIKHYTASYGFLDLEGQRAVFRLSPHKELTLNLSNINTQEFLL